jgi:hypothetical protein
MDRRDELTAAIEKAVVSGETAGTQPLMDELFSLSQELEQHGVGPDDEKHDMRWDRDPTGNLYFARKADQNKEWLLGVNWRKAARDMWENPEKFGDMLWHSAQMAQDNLFYAGAADEGRTIAGFLEGAQTDMRLVAAEHAKERYGHTEDPALMEAYANHVYETMQTTHYGGILAEYPNLTEFMGGFGVPTLPLDPVFFKGVAAVTKQAGKTAVKASKWVAEEVGVDPGISKATKRVVNDYLADNPLIGAHWKATVDMAGRAKERVGAGVDVVKETGAALHNIFDYQAWARRIKWKMRNEAEADHFFDAVRYKSQLVIGELERMETEYIRLALKNVGAAGEHARELFMILDTPHAMVTVPDDVTEAYRIIVNRALQKPRSKRNRALVENIIDSSASPRAKLQPDEKALLKGLSEEQRQLIADVIDDPYSHIEVRPELRQLVAEGIRLKEIDQAASAMASKMNQFVSRRRMAPRGGAKKIADVKAGSGKVRVREAIRSAKRDAEVFDAGAEVEELMPGKQRLLYRKLFGSDPVLQRKEMRIGWVPWKLPEKTKRGPKVRLPGQVTAKHPSALARTSDFDTMILDGMSEDPFENFMLHAKTAFPDYRRGAQLKAVTRVMQGSDNVVWLRNADVTEAADVATRLAKEITKHEQAFGRTWGEIDKIEGKIFQLQNQLGKLGEVRPSIMSARSAASTKARKRTSRMVAIEKKLDALDNEGTDLEKRLSALGDDSPLRRNLVDRQRAITTQTRALEQRWKKLWMKQGQLQMVSSKPTNVARTGPAAMRRTRPGEAWSKEQLDEFAAKYSGKRMQVMKKRLLGMKRNASALHLVAQQHAMRRSAYRQAATTAAYEHATRLEHWKKYNEMIPALEKATGMKWVDFASMGMAPAAKKEFLRVVGDVGRTASSDIILVPENFAHYLQDMLPFAGTEGGKLHNVVKVYNAAMGYVIRPFTTTWRLLVTVPRSLYIGNNFTSSVSLSAVALKGRSLDPGLQSKALLGSILAAVKHPQAVDFAKQIPVQLDDGVYSLAEVIDKAQLLGLMTQLEKEIGSALQIHGPGQYLPKLMKNVLEADFISAPVKWGVDKITRGSVHHPTAGDDMVALLNAMSPAFHARWTENYQHFSTFLGFLKKMSDEGVQEAFTKTSKWSANYNLMTEAEKHFVKDWFAFYGWTKFILPYIVKFAKDRPDVLAQVIRAKGGWEHYASKYAPVSNEELPKFLRYTGMSAAPGAQPQEHIEVPANVAVYSVGSGQDPLTLSLGIMPLIDGLRTMGAKGVPISSLIAPGLALAGDFLSLRDDYGGSLPDFIDTSSKTALQDSMLWRLIMGSSKGLTQPALDLIDLYTGHPEQLSLELRFKGGKAILGMDNHFARFFGFEPRSIGGMLDPATGGVPGVSVYPVMLHEEQYRERNRILYRTRKRLGARKRIIEQRRD